MSPQQHIFGVIIMNDKTKYSNNNKKIGIHNNS